MLRATARTIEPATGHPIGRKQGCSLGQGERALRAKGSDSGVLTAILTDELALTIPSNIHKKRDY